MVFFLPEVVQPIERNAHWPAKCAICWYEHDRVTESPDAEAAVAHLRDEHPWWAEARSSFA